MIRAFHITAEDIHEGAPESSCNCAAARAIGRELPGREIEVWSDVVVIDGAEVAPPPELVAFIAVFDEFKTPAPISFSLDVPEARA